MVAGDVTGELFAIRRIPTSIAFSFWLQPGAQAKTCHHSIRLKLQQIFAIQILRDGREYTLTAEIGEETKTK